MEWRDTGTLLAARRHGESAAIIEVFTAGHGRHLGVVRGGGGRRMAPLLQPGARLDLTWRARLEDHIGTYTVEPVGSRSAAIMADGAALAALNAVCALCVWSLPEREPHAAFHGKTETLLDMLAVAEAWPLAYLRWELALLDEMGFGLSLDSCAVTGATDGLAHISPRTGRAVARGAGGAWTERLLPLPAVFTQTRTASGAEIAEALAVTGDFFARWLVPALGDRPIPGARARLIDRLARQG